MTLDNYTKALLSRWEGLKSGDGLLRAAKVALALRIVGLIAFVLASVALIQGISPMFAVIGAAVFGWTTAEANALSQRARMWPIFSRYIDWNRVRDDLHGSVPQI